MTAPHAQAEPGTVYLVGAGPGDPELLTLRAHRLLATADCILHDDLVGEEILAVASPTAILRNVGKRCGQKSITQQNIHEFMIHYVRQGHSVVRLKSGDPLIFGRAGEEMAALSEAQIPFEIVPGISAAFAAAAVAKVSLTDRETSSQVVLTTRHLVAKQGGTGDPANSSAALEPSSTLGSNWGSTLGSTLAFYMPGKDYAALQSEMLAQGWPSSTECILVSSASTSQQARHATALEDLADSPVLPAPVVILILPRPHRSERIP